MSCDKTYGVSFCGFDNYTYNHPDYTNHPAHPNNGCKCEVTNYFPESKIGDTGFYVCDQEVTDKIFKRLHCGQEVLPEYRPGFEVCRQPVNLNGNMSHPRIDMIDPCSDPMNSFTPCKGDGLGYLKRILVDSELKCMNQYLSKVHETSAFKPSKIPNIATHGTYVSVAGEGLGPHGVCGPVTINKCIEYPYKKEECGPYGLLQTGEGEKPINRRITADEGAHMFLPLGPTRCDELNRCEMTWDNNTKRHYKDARPNYVKQEGGYAPLAFEGHPVSCPPVCKYDYTCI
jgi:hypothetical protein